VDVSSTAAALRAIKLTQCIVGALTIWVIGALARQAAGSTAAAIASLLAAIYPPLVWIPAYVLSETLYSFLALAAALLLGLVYDDTLRSRRLLATAGAGALTGLATLTRPATLLFAALIVLWSMFAFQRERVGIAVFLAMTLGVITPWTIRNFARYHRIVLIASEGGVTFWTGNHPLATGEGDMAANPEIKRADIEFRRRHPGLSAEELDAIYYRDALRFIASRPLWWIGLLARKMFYTVVPIGPSYRLHSPLYFVGSAVSYLLVFPFAVAGFIELRRRSNRRHGGAWLPPPRALVLLAISAVAACLIFFPQERFRIPVIDPTLIVGASAWIATRSVFEPAMDVARLNA
jgi:4-amino-4-deoxy-L-arabinose transferase-like glycosyltransferase